MEERIMSRKKEFTQGEIFAKEIIAKYKPKTVEDMQNALKDIFGPMFEAKTLHRASLQSFSFLEELPTHPPTKTSLCIFGNLNTVR